MHDGGKWNVPKTTALLGVGRVGVGDRQANFATEADKGVTDKGMPTRCFNQVPNNVLLPIGTVSDTAISINERTPIVPICFQKSYTATTP